MTALARFATQRPLIVLALFLASTALFARAMLGITIDTDVEALMPEHHPELQYNRWAEDYFGIDEPVVLIVVDDGDDGVFTPETLGLVTFLSSELARIDGLDGDDVISLSEVDDITADEASLEVEPFFVEAPKSLEEARAVREAVFANPMMVGTVVSTDATATLIMADKRGTDIDKVAVYRQLRAIVDRAPITTQSVSIAGRPMIESEMGQIAARDLAVMIPIVLIVASTVLWFALRCVRGVLLPLVVVIASVLWALGLMASVGTTFYTFNVIMPIILIPIGIADGIHIIDHFLRLAAADPKRSARDLAFETMQAMTTPVVLTSITTAVGLASLVVSEIQAIRVLGFYSACGVMAAMLFSLTLIPAMLAALPLPRAAAAKIRRNRLERRSMLPAALDRVGEWVVRRPRTTLWSAAAVVVIAVTGLPQVYVDASLVRNFPPDNPIRVSDESIRERFTGSTPTEIVVEADEVDAWKDPANLRALAALQDRLEDGGLTGETRSIADYIKRMNQVMNPEDPGAYRIPDDRNLIAQYLLLYSISGEPDDLDDVVDYDYRIANLRAQGTSDSSLVLARLFDRIDADADELLAPLGLRTHASGIGRVMNTFMELIITGQTRSLLLAIGLITIVSGLLFRSRRLGLITAVPVALATVVNFGVLGWCGIALGVTTAMCSSVGIGIGVDFAIHFVSRYRRAIANGETPEAAMHTTVTSAGTAILYNALVIVAGFLVMISSGFMPNRTFGWLVSLAMVVCFVTTVTTMAALLLYYARGGSAPTAKQSYPGALAA